MVKSDYTESLLNIIMDEVDDIIMILDTDHTIAWMNRAGTKAFGVELKDTVGKRCYSLFGKTGSCEDCTIWTESIVKSSKPKIKIIPKTGKEYVCTTLPLYQDGEAKLFVQHLREVRHGVVD